MHVFYMKIWLWVSNGSWKLKWSSGDALLINYFRKAPAWNPVWSNHEAWRIGKMGRGGRREFFFW